MSKLENIEKNPTTEELIKEAARRVFTQKGYAATRTRDIAEEAGINLALINYYFRSKEKLFDIIMMEHIMTFVHSVMGIVDDRTTTLEEKLQILIDHYIDMLISNPNLPIFILNEVNVDPKRLIDRLGIGIEKRKQVYMMQQLQEMMAKGMPPYNPIHLLMNIVGLTIFPFVGSPLIRNRTGLSIEEFNKLMIERKKLIPVWIKTIMITGTTEQQSI